jgi:hypothetical protein
LFSKRARSPDENESAGCKHHRHRPGSEPSSPNGPNELHLPYSIRRPPPPRSVNECTVLTRSPLQTSPAWPDIRPAAGGLSDRPDGRDRQSRVVQRGNNPSEDLAQLPEQPLCTSAGRTGCAARSRAGHLALAVQQPDHKGTTRPVPTDRRPALSANRVELTREIARPTELLKTATSRSSPDVLGARDPQLRPFDRPARAANGQQTSEISLAQPRGIESRETRIAA